MDTKVFLGIIGLYIVVILWHLVKGIINKRFIYELKKTSNSIWQLFNSILLVYLFLLALMPIPAIVEWILSTVTTSTLARYLLAFTPIAYLIIVIYMIVAVAKHFSWNVIKYNNKEMEYQKQMNEKFRKHLPKWAYWLVTN